MINRFDLVTRHHPVLRALDPLSPLSVGNGEFVFTADITGLQTFADAYEDGMPLHTMSQWAWHSSPPPIEIPDGAGLENCEFDGRPIAYLSGQPQKGEYPPAEMGLRTNPHRLDLGRLGFVLRHKGQNAAPDEVENIEQTLDLWSGILHSAWTWLGGAVRVETICHPALDCIAVRVSAPDLAGKIGLKLAFPYGREDWKRAADWEKPDAHRTTATVAMSSTNFERVLDDDSYFARWQWNDDFELQQTGAHEWELWPKNENFEFCLSFAPQPIEDALPSFDEIKAASRAHWAAFWRSGAALDLSGSTDERAHELERRVVLSQYQTAINCAGSMPPAETGLVCNSWFGKFHLEMHFWHAAHFAVWNRPKLLEKSLSWYQKILPVARENAKKQGFAGARWPKMVGPEGRDSPSGIGVFLLWQQAHPLIFAEMCRAANPDNEREWLEKYADLVFPTAEFIADYARRDESGRFILGPPLIPAQESYGPWKSTNCNPTFELALWHYALGVAQQWRERLGLERVELWDEIRDNLAHPTVKDGIYQAMETEPHLIRRDHPSMLCALGVLPPTPLIDEKTMEKTLESVLADWDWPSTWGWDYPVMAMTAARVGRGDLAVESLLLDVPKNRYLPNGHNYQDARLPLYLPGNGGLLLAVALMAGGWKDAPFVHAPGFPQDGNWTVVSEGFVVSP